MYTHISNDIKFDDSVEISKNKKKELLDEFVTGNMDKTLLRDLKTSIGSETNSEISCDGSRSSSGNQQGLDMLSLAFPSPVDINNQLKSSSSINSFTGINSSIGINSSSTEQPSHIKEKKDYKKIFQRNVHKVTNFLQLCKPNKQEKLVDAKVSDREIQEMFNGIEETCDLIINEQPEHNLLLEEGNIELHINSFEKEDTNMNQFISICDNENNILNIENVDNNSEQIDTMRIKAFSIEETKSLDEYTNHQEFEPEPVPAVNEEPEPVSNEEPEAVQITNEEPEPVSNEEPEAVQITNEEPEAVSNEEPVKKKRTYNRKKK
jgi:hypothetical protein